MEGKAYLCPRLSKLGGGCGIRRTLALPYPSGRGRFSRGIRGQLFMDDPEIFLRSNSTYSTTSPYPYGQQNLPCDIGSRKNRVNITLLGNFAHVDDLHRPLLSPSFI